VYIRCAAYEYSRTDCSQRHTNAHSRTTAADTALAVKIPLPERTKSLIWHRPRSRNFLGSVQRIVNNQLHYRKVRVCWVPKMLSHELCHVFHRLHRTRSTESPETQNRKAFMTWKTLLSPIKGTQSNTNRKNYSNSLFGLYISLLVDFLESGKSTCWGFLWYSVKFMAVHSSQKVWF